MLVEAKACQSWRVFEAQCSNTSNNLQG